MNKLVKTLLFLMLLFWGVQDLWAKKTYVVAVGISNYLYPDVCPSLPCSVGDARSIAHFFHDYNGSSVFMLLNDNATRDHILRVLKKEFAKSGPEDEIIFAFSGHGIEGGLTCYETQDLNSLITYNEIQDIMNNARARRKIILAMACYSGGLALKPIKGKQTRRGTDKTSVMIFTSSRANEVSWENVMMRNSFFVDRLIEAFKGQADVNHDRKVTARELFNYVAPMVTIDTSGKQHPQLWGKFDDSMVVVYVN